MSYPVLKLEPYLTQPDNHAERLADPGQPLAVVEHGVDARPILDEVARHADTIRAPHTNRGIYCTYGSGVWASHLYGSNTNDIDFLTSAKRRFESLVGVARIAHLHATMGDLMLSATDLVQGNNLINIANRHRGGNIGHTDASEVTAHLGTNAPGLRVFIDGGWHAIPKVPTGHALLWRGDGHPLGEGYALKHTIDYRSSALARVSILAAYKSAE